MNIQDIISTVQASYDEDIQRGPEVNNAYSHPPDYIANDPDYQIYRDTLNRSTVQGNNREIVCHFLKPSRGHRFVDLGCGLDLILRGYGKWQSEYYGIDISPKSIKLLARHATQSELVVGALHCGSIHATPFQSTFFDIGECIGVLEYYEEPFVSLAIEEMYRIMKPRGKIVLDIPNVGHPACRIMMEIEKCMGRPDRFNLSRNTFENILSSFFRIIRVVDDNAVLCYFLEKRTNFFAGSGA